MCVWGFSPLFRSIAESGGPRSLQLCGHTMCCWLLHGCIVYIVRVRWLGLHEPDCL
jgi:hypothetical protein